MVLNMKANGRKIRMLEMGEECKSGWMGHGMRVIGNIIKLMEGAD